MIQPIRVVFDCNTLLQALASPGGPAGRCYQLASEGRFSLFVSPTVLSELRDVTSRPKLVQK
jgi:predicted nucleic acid-binding protein